MNSRRLKDILLVVIANVIAFAMLFALIMKVKYLIHLF